MAQYYTIITTAGEAAIANATVTQTKVNITTLAVGDGNGTEYSPDGTETALRREVWRGPTSQVSVDPNNLNHIVINSAIPSEVGGFVIREFGLYDSANVLIAIANYPETYKPVINDGTVFDLALDTVIEVNNVDAVEVNVDPTVITASKKYVQDSISPISQQLAQISKHVTEYGAKGDFVTDDTQAFNDAIVDCVANGYKLVTNGYRYKVTQIDIAENAVIDFSDSVIKRLPTNQNSYKIINIENIDDFMIINPTIIGDVDEHITTPSTNPNNIDGFAGEWGMGISILNSKGLIINPTISKCWGDGIYVYGNDTKIRIQGDFRVDGCRRQAISIICGAIVELDDLYASNINRTKPAYAIDIESNNSNEHVGIVKVKNIYAKNCRGAAYVVTRGNSVDNISIGNIYSEECEYNVSFAYSELGDETNASEGLSNINENGVINIENIFVKSAKRHIVDIHRSLYNVFPRIVIGNISVEQMIYDSEYITDETLEWNVILFFADRNYTYKEYGRLLVKSIYIKEIVNKQSIIIFNGLNRLSAGINDCYQKDIFIEEYSVINDNSILSLPYSNFTNVTNCNFENSVKLNILQTGNVIVRNGMNLSIGNAIEIREQASDAIVFVRSNYIDLTLHSHVLRDYSVYINDTLVTASPSRIFNMTDQTIYIKRNENEKKLYIYYRNYDILNTSGSRPTNAIAGTVKANPTTKKLEWFDGVNWVNADGTNA